MELREKLDKLCKEKGMTHAALARRAKVTKPAVSAWIKDGSKPGLENLLTLSRVLAVDMAWLADDAADWPPPRPDPQEDEILRASRRIGYDRALDRLYALPEVKPGSGVDPIRKDGEGPGGAHVPRRKRKGPNQSA